MCRVYFLNRTHWTYWSSASFVSHSSDLHLVLTLNNDGSKQRNGVHGVHLFVAIIKSHLSTHHSIFIQFHCVVPRRLAFVLTNSTLWNYRVVINKLY